MKKIIICFVFLQVTIGFAQRPNGGRAPQAPQGVNTQRSGQPEMQKFEAHKVAGVLEYDAKKVLKKLKLKKSDSIASKVTLAIENYNSQMQKIMATNKDLFEGLDVVINQNMQAAFKNKDKESARATMQLAIAKLSPVRTEVETHEKTLNDALKLVFSKDQFKKWIDFQKAKKDRLKPRKKKIDARDKPRIKSNAARNQSFKP